MLQALKNYPKKSIAGLDEIACELFADERKLVLLETPPPGQHNCSAYAIYQVTGRDTIRLPQFNTNKGIVHAAYSGTLALSNFDNAILVAPFRPDARHVYGASGSVSIDLIYFVQRLGQPEPRDAPIPSALSTAAGPADSRLGSAGNLFQTVDVEDAVADRKRRVAEEMRKGLAAVVRDNPPSTARKATVDPLAANYHPHRNESLVAFSRDQPCQIIGGLDGQKDKMPNQSTPVQERRDAPEVAPPAATQPQAAVGEQREAQKSVPPPTTQQRIAAEAKRQQVLTNMQSIVCHVVCAFRVMSIGFIRKEVLLSSTSLTQKAFVAISAGLVLRDSSDDIKHGLANALFAYHPNAPMKIHSVNDTLEVAIPSLQTVTSDVQLSLRVRTKCACKRRLSKAEHLSRSAFAAHTVTLTDLGAHEDILKNFDSACKSSASLIIASTLRQATCQACHEVMSPDGLLFPKSFAFVLESHTQAYNTCVFDLLGRELQLDDFSKTVYRVAALVIHSQTRQRYCTLEFADAGLAYSYDHLSGLRLVHRCEVPPEVTANEHAIPFDRWLDQIGADASVTTVSVLAASARHVRVRSSYIDAAKTLRLPQASSPFAIARSGLGSLSSAPVSNQPPIPDTVPSTAEEGEDVDMPLCETQNTSPNDDGRLRSFRRAQENNDVVDPDKESEENKDFEEVQERIAVIGTKRAQSGLELAGHHKQMRSTIVLQASTNVGFHDLRRDYALEHRSSEGTVSFSKLRIERPHLSGGSTYAVISLFDGASTALDIIGSCNKRKPSALIAVENDTVVRQLIGPIRHFSGTPEWRYTASGCPALYLEDVADLFREHGKAIKQMLALCPQHLSRIYVIAGSPCQDLSISGYNRGYLGVTRKRSVAFHYIWATLRALQLLADPATSIQPLIENAGSMLSIFRDHILACSGLPMSAAHAIDAGDFGKLMVRKHLFFSRQLEPTTGNTLPSTQCLEAGWSPFLTSNVKGDVTPVKLPPVMRPRGAFPDGSPRLPTTFYHPKHLLYRVSHFGDMRTFEALCVSSCSQSKAYPAIKWEEFIPASLLDSWNILCSWQPGKGKYLEPHIEDSLIPLQEFLHATLLPFRPVSLAEILADAELLEAFRYVPAMLPQTHVTVASLAGNAFIPSVVQPFVVRDESRRHPLLPVPSPTALEERYKRLIEAVHGNLDAAVKAGRLTQSTADGWAADIQPRPLSPQLLEASFWYAIQHTAVQQPEVLPCLTNLPRWIPLIHSALGGSGAAFIYEPPALTQQLFAQLNGSFNVLLRGLLPNTEGDISVAACVQVSQIFAAYRHSLSIGKVSFATFGVAGRYYALRAYIRYFAFCLHLFSRLHFTQRVYILYEENNVPRLWRFDPISGSVPSSVCIIVLAPTLPDVCFLQCQCSYSVAPCSSPPAWSALLSARNAGRYWRSCCNSCSGW